MGDLSNETALVTGGSRGIGRATARAFAEAGAHTIIHYSRSAADATSLLAEIRTAGGRADVAQADLATLDGVIALTEQVQKIVAGRLNILVANAGIAKAAPLEEQTVEDFDRLFATNVRGPFFLVQRLLPLLSEGANIVLVSSLTARAVPGSMAAVHAGRALPSLSVYGATKGAIDTLVKHFACALGPRGIRVNAVAPGVIETDMSSVTKTEAGREMIFGMQALRRIGQPADVADVIAFLASNRARWINGVTIAVDGGSKL